MPVYAYKGLNTKGRNVGGIIDADSPKGARQKLRRTGVYPIDLTEQRSEQGAVSGRWSLSVDVSTWFERVSPQDLSLLTRQLATLVGAGLPLVECLNALIEQVDSARQKRILSQVREKVVEGGTLADALKAHPRVFNELFVNMVRAGEASGALDIVLVRLADYTERAAQLRTKVRSALTYPTFMALAGGSILLFLLSYVVPKITRIFQETQQSLPTITLALLAISGFAQRYWWLVVSAVLFAVIAVRASTRTPVGRLRFDRAVLRLPYIGKLLKKVALARFSRTLSTLLQGGLALLPSLDIVKNVVSNMVLQNAIEDGRNSIREGQSVAEPLRKSGVFPPLLVHMIAVGEKSGELESMLARAADAYDNEVEASVNALSTIMEPLIIIFMGAIVMFIVFAVMLPIFELNDLVR